MHRPKLPFLPGYTFDSSKCGQNRFNKPHFFDKIHEGVYYLTERVHRYQSVLQDETPIPPWIVFDGQKLVFEAYFEELLRERCETRIRSVFMFFFLEDGTMKISEPRTSNSGLEQGVLVGRQRIPNPQESRFYDVIDLNIGKEATIFGRVYKIVDCDKFTRKFLNHVGIPVPDPIVSPLCPRDDATKSADFPKKFAPKIYTLEKFLKNDQQILRFYAYWDDRDRLYGIVHDLEIHYYLTDDTMDVKEILPLNSGKDGGPMLVKKTKIPKFYSRLEPIGAREPVTILNVLGENMQKVKTYYMLDSLNTGKDSLDYYKDHDLYIGAQINVFGRKVIITNMDESTEKYYRTQYGMEDFTPIKSPNKKYDETCKIAERYIPPYNGYGSYQDSLGNCLSVIPKPPRIDFTKFFFHDKQGSDSNVLRFRAKMISRIPENAERQFIIRFFLMDDTISIYELSDENSGFQRCIFQKPMKVMLPAQNIFTNKEPKYFEAKDFYIGACLNLSSFQFLITSADVYALRYMEIHSSEFPKANIRLIMDKLRESLRPFYQEFLQHSAPLTPKDKSLLLEYKKLKEVLCKFLGDKITEHEMITIARQYSCHEKKEFHSREFVRAIVHTELNRRLWDKLDRLEECIHHVDRARSGYLPREELYAILRGSRIPLHVELLNSVLDHLCKNEEGKIDCCDLLGFLNVKVDPLLPVPPINVKTSLWWALEKESDCGFGIDWCSFLNDLGLSDEQKSALESSPIVD